jgi:hypothetical protein
VNLHQLLYFTWLRQHCGRLLTERWDPSKRLQAEMKEGQLVARTVGTVEWKEQMESKGSRRQWI